MPSPLVSLLIAALGLFAVRLAGRRSPLLTGISLGTLLLLPLMAYLPKVSVSLPSTAAHFTPTATSQIFLILYLLGVTFFTSRLLFDLVAFRKWQKQAYETEDERLLFFHDHVRGRMNAPRNIILQLHSDTPGPVATGLFRPRVVLPTSACAWDEETLMSVLSHEIGHHVRNDLWTSLVARTACIVHWFNPLAWLLKRQLLIQCEFACDRQVLTAGFDARKYAHTLCNLAVPISQAPATPPMTIAMAHPSSLRARVENLLSPSRPLSSFSVLATLLLTLGTAVAFSTLRPETLSSLPFSNPLGEVLAPQVFGPKEVDLRLSANPFPGEE